MVTIPNEVKALFSSDTVHKNFHVTFPNGETTDLNNENVISESVKFTESLCSQQYFKFGLAEASQIEFVAVGIPNVRGVYIECGIEIDCTRLGAAWAAAHPVDASLPFLTPQTCNYDGKLYYRVPYGRFKVDTCPRNHGAMYMRKVTAYSDTVHNNDQMSKYEIAKENAFAKQQPRFTFNLMKFVLSNVYANSIGGILSNGFELKGTWTPAGQTLSRSYINLHIDDVAGTYNMTLGIRVIEIPIAPTTEGLDYIYRIAGSLAVIDKIDSAISNLCDNWGFSGSLETIKKYTHPKIKFASTDYVKTDFSDLYEVEDDDFIIYPTRKYPVNTAYLYIPDGYEYTIYYSSTGNVASQAAVYYSTYVNNNLSIKYYDEATETMLGSVNITVGSTLTQKVGKVKYYSYANSLSFTYLVQGFLELCGWFLKPDRSGSLEFFQMSLSPTPISVSASDWSEFWWDETPIESIGQVNVIYTVDNEEQQETFSIGSGNSVYTIENNEVLKAAEMDTATMESILQIYFAPNASVVNFTPVDLSMRGLPYLESGDYIELTAEDGETVDTYILSQTISGIQHLTAEITSTNGNLLEVIA